MLFDHAMHIVRLCGQVGPGPHVAAAQCTGGNACWLQMARSELELDVPEGAELPENPVRRQRTRGA